MDLTTKQERGKSFIITENRATDILAYNSVLTEEISSLSIKVITHKE